MVGAGLIHPPMPSHGQHTTLPAALLTLPAAQQVCGDRGQFRPRIHLQCRQRLDDRSILGGNKIAFCNGFFIVPYGLGNKFDFFRRNQLDNGQHRDHRIVGEKSAFCQWPAIYSACWSLPRDIDRFGTDWIPDTRRYYTRHSLHGCQIATDGSRLVTVGGTRRRGVPITTQRLYRIIPDALVTVGITTLAPAQIVPSGFSSVGHIGRICDALLGADSQQLANAYRHSPITPRICSRGYRGDKFFPPLYRGCCFD